MGKEKAPAAMGSPADNPAAAPRGVLAFASLGMPRESLRALLHQAQRHQVPVMLRGVLPQGFRATVLVIQQLLDSSPDTPLAKGEALTGGMGIDPLWFRTFSIKQVPAFVSVRSGACAPKQPCTAHDFDVLYGNMSLPSALHILANQGENPEPARQALDRGQST